MNILITAGPTREYLDDVRFISNPSSGKMGFEFARVFQRAGHRVRLISGPVSLAPPKGIPCTSVTSTRDMKTAVDREFPWCDCLVMTAAPSDYRPARRQRGKIKKTEEKRVMELVRNPDILKGVSRRKGNRITVGFALESARLKQNALGKLTAKKLDLIVANRPDSFGADRVSVTLFGSDGSETSHIGITKAAVARLVLKHIDQRVKEKRSHKGGK